MGPNHNVPASGEFAAKAASSMPKTGMGAPSAGVKRIPSFVIFCDACEVEIEHNGALYRLRRTALGKLILTK